MEIKAIAKKWGSSIGIILPKAVVEENRIRENDEITIEINKNYDVTASATDPDGDSLTYKWTVSGGAINNDAANPMKWTTPNAAGDYTIQVKVTDGNLEVIVQGPWYRTILWEVPLLALISELYFQTGPSPFYQSMVKAV